MKKFIQKLTGLLSIAILLAGLFQDANFAATNATIEITGDDAYILYVNGEEVGRDWQDPGKDLTRWRSVETYNVTLLDDYIIAIEAADLFGTIAGVSVKVTIGQQSPFYISDGVWKVSTSVNSDWKIQKEYAAVDNWSAVTPVTPHASWPSDAGSWGWAQNAVAPNITTKAFFKYFIPIPSVINVRHYIAGTETAFAEAQVLNGSNGLAYSTSPAPHDGYTVSQPQNASGTFTVNPINVVYYYTLIQPTTQPPSEQPPTTQPPSTQPPAEQPTEPQGPSGNVQIVYVDELGNTLSPAFQFSGQIGTNYSTSSISIDGYTLIETPANASGSFVEGTTVVSYVYSNGTVVLEDEAVALGDVNVVDFDAILPVEALPTDEQLEKTEEQVEAEIVLDEATPLADALPQTGQIPAGAFIGLGGLISAIGLVLKRKI